MDAHRTLLPADSNQALGIGEFAVEFLRTGDPSALVRDRTKAFHADAVLCGASALALKTNAPTLLREEALEYPDAGGATVFGTDARVKAEKAVVANASAVREWDSNGTNFGYNPELGHLAGEFGHNDYYPVAVAACQENGEGGARALLGMILIDEIRGRLAEVFSLKTYKIDHVLHGAIASAAAYVALRGGTPEQIESAIGLTVAHYVPWRAIRAGKQLSDSKGASAALSSEVAVLSARRALRGFVGPRDIFRNPEAAFRQFAPTSGDSPFRLVLSHSGEDFAVMGMHFKIGLYEHQSAGAIGGVIALLGRDPEAVLNARHFTVVAYEPAFGIIGDPAKRDPKTRQSADHSMVYIVARVLRKAARIGATALRGRAPEGLWSDLMLLPEDYGVEALADAETRAIMVRISFEHGGPEYDAKYPDGIPTSVRIETEGGDVLDSGLVMYPAGHARNTEIDRDNLLRKKWGLLAGVASEDAAAAAALLERLTRLEELTPQELLGLYDLPIANRAPIDG